MLRKIISIKNVGRFRSSAAPGNPELSRYTLIVGANGFGKTTLCAVLRSLKAGNPSLIEGRRTLGVDKPPTLELLLASGSVRFNGTAWSVPYPHLAIFDEVFVAENVHSGEAVTVDQRRNLYRIVIGEEGVSLAEEDAKLARQSREKTGEITAVVEAIKPHIPIGITFDSFLALPADPNIDERIAEQERSVEAVRQAQEINDRPLLSEIVLPTLPDEFSAPLMRTIDDIARDAETRVADHFRSHKMESDGGNWIAEKLEHADGENCPFCGQDIRGLPLITAYRAVFSDRYKALRDDISAMRVEIAELFGEGAIGSLNTLVERNRGIADFWRRFCTFDIQPLTVPDSVPEGIRGLRKAAIALLDKKAQAPLESVQPDANFYMAANAFSVAQGDVQEIAGSIQAANTQVAAKKQETSSVDVQAAKTELVRRRAIKVRHADHVINLCCDHVRLIRLNEDIEQTKLNIREQLNAYTGNVVRPYEKRINDYLDAFNADFRITETRHHFPSGIAATTYCLVINDTAIDLGNDGTPLDQPSFKNTLSSGDRTTLALAFFLTNLERDPKIALKTVVFDDPFGSQDAFRRRQTVYEIGKVGRSSAQVLVLSHDATFLKQIWDKAPAAERVALTLADHRAQGTKILTVDLEGACQGRTATDFDDLLTFQQIGNRRGTGRHSQNANCSRELLLHNLCYLF